MIRLETNEGFLDLFPNTSVNLRIISPAFSKELQDNTHSFSFSIPGSDNNRRLLGLYDSSLVYNAETESEVKLWYGGNVFKKGKIRIKTGGGNPLSYSIVFETDTSALAKVLKDTKLKDIDLGGHREIAGLATASEEISITIDNPSGIASIEINNITYGILLNPSMNQEDIMTFFANAINNDNTNNVDAAVLGTGINATLQLSPSVGFNQLDINLNLAGNQQRWSIVGQIGQGEVVHSTMITHMNDVVNSSLGTYDYTFAPIYNPDFYDGQNTDYLEFVNLWDWTANTFLENTDVSGQQWRNTAIPFPRLSYLVKQAINHLGYTDISSFTDSLEFKQIHLWNNVSLDQDWNGTNYFQTFIDIKNHVPESLTLADLFNYIRDKFNVSIDINYTNKTFDFIPKKDIPKKGQEDWRGISLDRILVERDKLDDRGYELTHKEDTNDIYFEVFSGAVLRGTTHLAGAKKITDTFPPLPPYNRFHPLTSGEMNIPVIGQTGKTVFPEVEDDGFIFRAFFFKGFQVGINTSNTYPYATMSNIDFFGNNIGAYSLHLTELPGVSSRGTKEESYEPIERDENAEINQLIKLEFVHLKNLDVHKPKLLQHEDGAPLGVVKSIDVELTMKSIGLSNIKFHRL